MQKYVTESQPLTQEIDWSLRWREARRQHSIFGERAMEVSFWDEYWSREDRGESLQEERIIWSLGQMPLTPESTILDIGCGDGQLTLPIAERVKLVTAIDPSKIAIDRLARNASRRGLSNIRFMNRSWNNLRPGIDFPPHDIVVASFVMATLDLHQALTAMLHAGRMVYIFETVGPRYWHYPELWPGLMGRPFTAAPDYIYIVNALHQMGIYASVTQHIYQTEEKYHTFDEAVSKIKKSMNISDSKSDSIIIDYLVSRLKPDAEGWHIQHRQRIAAIFWRNETVN